MTKFSAFADCNSETVVIRVPYEFAATLVKNCPPSEEREELVYWLKIAASRAKNFGKLLDSLNNQED